MRKLVAIFVVGWTFYCLIITGYPISQIKLSDTLAQDPSEQQDHADDIFNQGARIVKARRLNTDSHPAVYIEGDGLKALALTYWLYPVYLTPYSQDPAPLIFSKPPRNTVYFIVNDSTYKQYRSLLPKNYRSQEILRTKGQVFVLASKQ